MSDAPHYPDFNQVQTVLASAGAQCDAAESHGLLSGLLCAAGHIDSAGWLEHILGDSAAAHTPAGADARAMLSALLGETLQLLNDSEYRFHPLLPSDDEPLVRRTDALKAWCEGLLMGLSLGGMQMLPQLPEATQEIIQDVAEITRLNTEDQGDTEADEAAYFEIVEYVRVAVLLLREELRTVQRPRPEDVVVH